MNEIYFFPVRNSSLIYYSDIHSTIIEMIEYLFSTNAFLHTKKTCVVCIFFFIIVLKHTHAHTPMFDMTMIVRVRLENTRRRRRETVHVDLKEKIPRRDIQIKNNR